MKEALSLSHLTTVNTGVTTELFGSEFTECSLDDSLDVRAVIEANHELAEFLYGPEIAKLVRDHKFQRLNELHHSNLETVTAPEQLLEDVDLDELGVIVVRPEIVEAVEQCVDLIERNGLHIIYDKPLEINFEQYWGLYHHGLSDPDSYNDFPTRTLNYAGKSCHLLVLGRESDERSGALPLSDVITRDLKGEQGTYTPHTLRGDIAFTALKACIDPSSPLKMIGDANIALDPIGAYRHLVRGNIPSDRAHTKAQSPLLFYAGQGAHIPNSTEIDQDLRILCTQAEIESLLAHSQLPLKGAVA